MPSKPTQRRYHENFDLPDEGEYFVFGSNIAGRHGLGAALIAVELGARRGIGEGLCGKTYAIPTKARNLVRLSKEKIALHVERFVQFTKAHPDKSWFVTAIGCGHAGYHPADIAPNFKEAINCSFPEQWRIYLED